VPKSLAPIPLETAIVNPKDGTITQFFRLRWQTLIDIFSATPDVASVSLTNQNAAIVTANAFVTKSAGLYRVSYYLRKTVADGVSSSLTFTYGWTDGGVPLTESAAALSTDATSAEQSGSKLVFADQASGLSYAVAYASNTPGQMKYALRVVVEQLS
jgi:hypothetical protein